MSVIHHLLHTQCLKYTIYLNGSRKAQPSMLLRRCRMFTATCFKQVKQPQHETAVWVVRKTSCFKKSEYSHQTTVRHSIMGCTQHHLLSNRVDMHIKRPYGIAVWGVRNTTCFQTRLICKSNDRTAQQYGVYATPPAFKQGGYVTQTTVRHSSMGCAQHHLLSNKVDMHIKRPYGTAVYGAQDTTYFQTKYVFTVTVWIKATASVWRSILGGRTCHLCPYKHPHLVSRSLCDTNRVGQNHKYTVNIRYFWQGHHQKCGHIRCINTVLANPRHR